MNSITRTRPRIWLTLLAAFAFALAACGSDTGNGGQSFGTGDDAESTSDVMESIGTDN